MTQEKLKELIALSETIAELRDAWSSVFSYCEKPFDISVKCKIVFEGDGWDSHNPVPLEIMAKFLPLLKASQEELEAIFELL